ncbi:MAG: TIGR03943 family protein [Actinobacteria bacterium]|nr:TIGR03943 family protein [Actinomycetota bacterium]
MNREIQSILLILIGTATLRISLSDVYLRYVKAGMQPYLVISGAVLLALGIWALIDVVRASPTASASPDPSAESTQEDDHGHSHGLSYMAWMLVLPVIAILVVAPPALGAYSAGRSNATVTASDNGIYSALAPGDPVEVGVTSYASRAIWDDGKTLEGRTVEMTGFVTPDRNGGWWLTRLSMSCCAADALVTKIQVIDAPAPPTDTWVRVVGSWTPGGGTKDDRAIPLIEADSVEEVTAPKNTYE